MSSPSHFLLLSQGGITLQLKNRVNTRTRSVEDMAEGDERVFVSSFATWTVGTGPEGTGQLKGVESLLSFLKHII